MSRTLRRWRAGAATCLGLATTCSHERGRLQAADGRRHYVTYTAAGEVTDFTGAVNIYAATGAKDLSATAARAKPLVYVPNSRSASVDIIDPATYTVVRSFRTGEVPQHVVPAYDLATLWVLSNAASTATPIDPHTGVNGRPVHVDDPYNMYFTPDGQYAIVVAERRMRMDFLDPRTMDLVQSLRTDCRGIDHMEFTADGRYAIATCEFNGRLLKVDLSTRATLGMIALDTTVGDGGAMPQDVRSSPDGSVFLVADMKADGVRLIDPRVLQGDRVRSHRQRHPWHLSQPRRKTALCNQSRLEYARGGASRTRVDQCGRPGRSSRRRELANPGRRESGHGERHRRRKGAVGERPV